MTSVTELSDRSTRAIYLREAESLWNKLSAEAAALLLSGGTLDLERDDEFRASALAATIIEFLGQEAYDQFIKKKR